MINFKSAYLNNKFWTLNSVIVPDRKPDLNEFIDIKDLFRSESWKNKFEIYWDVPNISGECLLPGRHNYALIEGKWYHLEVSSSNGLMKDGDYIEEWFYYRIIYDDWMNDWMNNNVMIKGTITKTGDRDLVLKNIHQTTPLFSNVNKHEILNGINEKGNLQDRLIFKPCPLDNDNFKLKHSLSYYDYWRLLDELPKLTLKKPDPEKLVLPMVYVTNVTGNWKWQIITGVQELVRDSRMGVYDFNEKIGTKPQFQAKLNSNRIYVITNPENINHHYSKAHDATKYLSEFDLSNVTDLIELDQTTLARIETSTTYDSWTSITSVLIKRFNLDSSDSFLNPLNTQQINELKNLTNEIIARELNEIINPIKQTRAIKSKIYKNVELEPIKTIFNTKDASYTAYDIFNQTSLPFLKFQKNFIFNTSERSTRIVVNKYSGDKANELKQLFSTNNYSEFKKAWEQQKNNLSWVNFPINNFLSVGVIETYNFKLKCDECDDILDINKEDYNYLKTKRIIALIPDYLRDTHVLANGTFHNLGAAPNRKDKGTILFFNELAKDIQAQRYLHDVVQHYQTFGKAFYVLSKGYIFERLILDELYIVYKHWYSVTAGYWQTLGGGGGAGGFGGGISINKWINSPVNNFTTTRTDVGWNEYGGKQKIDLAISKLNVRNSTNEKNWREYHIMFTLPYRTELIDIAAILDEYKDLSDKLFVYEYYENGKTFKGKGTVSKYPYVWDNSGKKVRYANKTHIQNFKEKTFSVYINLWEEYGFGTIVKRAQELALKLYKVFFIDDWNRGNSGAIPTKQITYFKLKPNDNDNAWDDENGRKTIQLNWVKPYNDFNYIASIRIHTLKKENWLGFNDENTRFTIQGSDGWDWFVAITPEDYQNSGNPIPRYTYRQRYSQISKEALLTFLYSGYNHGYNPNLWEPIDGWAQTFDSWTERAQPWREFVLNAIDHKGENFSKLLYEDFIDNAKVEDIRTNNPTSLDTTYVIKPQDIKIPINTVQEDLPAYIAKYLDATLPINRTLYNWKSLTNNEATEQGGLKQLKWDKFKETYKRKITESIANAKVLIANDSSLYELVGSEWIVSIKWNIGEVGKPWDFELIGNPRLIKTLETEEWKFKAPEDNDVDSIINSFLELHVHGQSFPLKTRYLTPIISGDQKLWVPGLFVTPIEDKKQSELSTWYLVEINNLKLDVIRTIIEVLKDTTTHTNLSVYERQRLQRDISINESSRLLDSALQDIRVREFKMGDELEKTMNKIAYNENWWQGWFDLAQYGGMAASSFKTVTKRVKLLSPLQYLEKLVPFKKFPHYKPELHYSKSDYDYTKSLFNQRGLAPFVNWRYYNEAPVDRFTTVKGLSVDKSRFANALLAGFKNYASHEYQEQRLEAQELHREARKELALEEFELRGLAMQEQQQHKSYIDYLNLIQHSVNLDFPNNNSKLIYKNLNEQLNLNDIFIVRKYPGDELKKYINEFYKNNGYSIFIKNFECNGIDSIKTHIQYSVIETNQHHDYKIKSLIEARALQGIQIIEWKEGVENVIETTIEQPEVLTEAERPQLTDCPTNQQEDNQDKQQIQLLSNNLNNKKLEILDLQNQLKELNKKYEEAINYNQQYANENATLRSSIAAWMKAAQDLKGKYTIGTIQTGQQVAETRPEDLLSIEQTIDLDIKQKQALVKQYQVEIDKKRTELVQVNTGKPIQEWNYNDFLEKFVIEFKSDVGKFVRFLWKTDSKRYGLRMEEFAKNGLYLQWWRQNHEDLIALLDDNESMLVQDNEALRNELIEDPKLIRHVEGAFFHNWKRSFSRRFAELKRIAKAKDFKYELAYMTCYSNVKNAWQITTLADYEVLNWFYRIDMDRSTTELIIFWSQETKGTLKNYSWALWGWLISFNAYLGGQTNMRTFFEHADNYQYAWATDKNQYYARIIQEIATLCSTMAFQNTHGYFSDLHQLDEVFEKWEPETRRVAYMREYVVKHWKKGKKYYIGYKLALTVLSLMAFSNNTGKIDNIIAFFNAVTKEDYKTILFYNRFGWDREKNKENRYEDWDWQKNNKNERIRNWKNDLKLYFKFVKSISDEQEQERLADEYIKNNEDIESTRTN